MRDILRIQTSWVHQLKLINQSYTSLRICRQLTLLHFFKAKEKIKRHPVAISAESKGSCKALALMRANVKLVLNSKNRWIEYPSFATFGLPHENTANPVEKNIKSLKRRNTISTVLGGIFKSLLSCNRVKSIFSGRMQWQYFVALLVCLLVASAVAQQTADGSANAKTKQILSYIAGLPQQGM